MTYTEKELDQFLHGISLSLLSKKSAQHWRYDEETAKEIEWLEALERKVRADKADRKTEPTISKMEQVDEPTFEDGEDYLRGYQDGWNAHDTITRALYIDKPRGYTLKADSVTAYKKPKDESQTERSEE